MNLIYLFYWSLLQIYSSSIVSKIVHSVKIIQGVMIGQHLLENSYNFQ